ncbi:MAG: hypothetical protein QOE11_48 [Solirubrobacteraceae bacterium]|jgi:hypothetical protein|nr:hypothetical protein [Solirubrobacteraceae bacterium]
MLTPGRILRRELLGTEASYRVVEEDGAMVLVEVVSAPGLQPGFRLHLTPAAAGEMRSEAQAGHAAPRVRRRQPGASS